jgi:hypothetical protein
MERRGDAAIREMAKDRVIKRRKVRMVLSEIR